MHQSIILGRCVSQITLKKYDTEGGLPCMQCLKYDTNSMLIYMYILDICCLLGIAFGDGLVRFLRILGKTLFFIIKIVH